MRLTPRLAIGIALVCATLAAVLSYIYLSSAAKPKVPAKTAPVEAEVVVPVREIPVNTPITEDMLTRRKMNVEEIPRGAVKNPHELVGMVAVRRLPAGQPVEREAVLPRGEALGLAGLVPPGMRAVTVALDPITGVAGLLKTGDRVDVVATFEVNDNVVAKTILQDVELLALGTRTVDSGAPEEAAVEGEPVEEGSKDAAKGTKTTSGAAGGQSATKTKSRTTDAGKEIEYPNATLAVTPEDAQKLMLVDQRGDLRLALRPLTEHDFRPLPAVDLASVVGPEYAKLIARNKQPAPEPTPAAAPAAPPPPAAAAPPAGQQPPWTAWGAPAAPVTKPAPEKPAEPTKKTPEKKPPEPVLVIRGQQSEPVVP